MYRSFLKNWLDLIVSLAAFLILFPVFFIVTVILFFVNTGKPFYFQQRPGKDEKLFWIIKFKTMNDKRDSKGNLLSNKNRLTPIGKFIRKTSLDEIPQLLNVIKGEMSLVGPRPLLPEYLPLYSSYHRKRHSVKPGITGLAQISGRNNKKFSERFNLDVLYAEKLSFILDCSIIWNTFRKVLKPSDITVCEKVDEVDDLGITKNLPVHYFSKE